jgi:hypothetical protein
MMRLVELTTPGGPLRLAVPARDVRRVKGTVERIQSAKP